MCYEECIVFKEDVYLASFCNNSFNWPDSNTLTGSSYPLCVCVNSVVDAAYNKCVSYPFPVSIPAPPLRLSRRLWHKSTVWTALIKICVNSSIGMAKAALEAVNGMNLFGINGASWSVIYSDIDAHFRNRINFDSFLPRESASKVVSWHRRVRVVERAQLLPFSHPFWCISVVMFWQEWHQQCIVYLQKRKHIRSCYALLFHLCSLCLWCWNCGACFEAFLIISRGKWHY